MRVHDCKNISSPISSFLQCWWVFTSGKTGSMGNIGLLVAPRVQVFLCPLPFAEPLHTLVYPQLSVFMLEFTFSFPGLALVLPPNQREPTPSLISVLPLLKVGPFSNLAEIRWNSADLISCVPFLLFFCLSLNVPIFPGKLPQDYITTESLLHGHSRWTLLVPACTLDLPRS